MRPFSGNVTACISVVPIILGATLRHQHMPFSMPETKNCVTTGARADLKEWSRCSRWALVGVKWHSASGRVFAVATDEIERRLVAILMADVAGYSRLIGMDDEGTLAQLNAHHALIEPKIKEHRGRIVRTTGDGLLVLFVSAVDALRCAVEIQRAMTLRNAQIPPDRQIRFRMGINVGDIVEGASIHGDGINVAARLEGTGGT